MSNMLIGLAVPLIPLILIVCYNVHIYLLNKANKRGDK